MIDFPPGKKLSEIQDAYTHADLVAATGAMTDFLLRIAFERILRIYSEPIKGKKFAHGAVFRLEAGPWLVCSYHPSQQNTRTGKLTEEMFDGMWVKVNELIELK